MIYTLDGLQKGNYQTEKAKKANSMDIIGLENDGTVVHRFPSYKGKISHLGGDKILIRWSKNGVPNAGAWTGRYGEPSAFNKAVTVLGKASAVAGAAVLGGAAVGALGGTTTAGTTAKSGKLFSGLKDKLANIDLSKINLPKLDDKTKDLINEGLQSLNPLVKQQAEKVLNEQVKNEIKNPTEPTIVPTFLTDSKNLPLIIGAGFVILLLIILIAKK